MRQGQEVPRQVISDATGSINDSNIKIEKSSMQKLGGTFQMKKFNHLHVFMQ